MKKMPLILFVVCSPLIAQDAKLTSLMMQRRATMACSGDKASHGCLFCGDPSLPISPSPTNSLGQLLQGGVQP